MPSHYGIEYPPSHPDLYQEQNTLVVSSPGITHLVRAEIPDYTLIGVPTQDNPNPMLRHIKAIETFAFRTDIDPFDKARQFFERIQEFIGQRNIYELLIGCYLDVMDTAHLFPWLEQQTGQTYTQILLDNRWVRDVEPARKRWKVYKEALVWDPGNEHDLAKMVLEFDGDSINAAASRVRDFNRTYHKTLSEHPELPQAEAHRMGTIAVRERFETIRQTMPYDISRSKSVIVKTEEEVLADEETGPTPVYWSDLHDIGNFIDMRQRLPKDPVFLRQLDALYRQHNIKLLITLRGSDETRFLRDVSDEFAVALGEPTSDEYD